MMANYCWPLMIVCAFCWGAVAGRLYTVREIQNSELHITVEDESGCGVGIVDCKKHGRLGLEITLGKNAPRRQRWQLAESGAL